MMNFSSGDLYDILCRARDSMFNAQQTVWKGWISLEWNDGILRFSIVQCRK